jgi:hypothetical protein
VPRTGGSVARNPVSHVDPAEMRATANPSVTSGCVCSASTVATSGPTTKITSSSVDSIEYAVERCGASPGQTWDQRARISAPTFTRVKPISTAGASSVHSGALTVTRTASSTAIATCAARNGGSTRCWPCRSNSTPANGFPSAPPITKPPPITPA